MEKTTVRNDDLTALNLLELWALRICGGSLTDPTQAKEGGASGLDPEWFAALYVESTPGFSRARPILLAVHGQGISLENVRIQIGAEPLPEAFERLGWLGLDLFSRAKAVRYIYQSFLYRLENRMRKHPFQRPIAERRELTAYEIAAA